MRVRLSEVEAEPIFNEIYDFWKNIGAGRDAVSLDQLYERGIPRRSADAYLWKLDPNASFTPVQISELERQVDAIKGDAYPQALKDAVADLLDKLRQKQFHANIKAKAKNQALRNSYESKTGQSAAPGNGPANLIRKFANMEVPTAVGGRRSQKTRRLK